MLGWAQNSGEIWIYLAYFKPVLKNLPSFKHINISYSGDPNTEHLNNGTIWLTDYWKFVIQATSHATYDPE